ncbi:hypothetical protein [Cognatiyoonia sp. IB215182]|uniref:hypothetical protein n=1 Tax=Cognatiyoonia sp. IB215182 TaxID=3097353 RepID=UPI002A0FCEBD|nr:hypothetical protein [Cognatiyoonia sp. IB215182]MDX8351274.1 hypothetical protein [Cognatiyoonia sp. IB215182]
MLPVYRTHNHAAPTRAHRILFWIGAFFAGWVAVFTYAAHLMGQNPGLPFHAPPLHLWTIASLYLGGMVMMVLAARARTLSATRIPVVVAGLFTGFLLLVSLFHLERFDFSVPDRTGPLWGIVWLPLPFQVSWFWFVLYGMCPVVVAVLLRRYWHASQGVHYNPLPIALRSFLASIGLCGVAFALVLLITPRIGMLLWPWEISVFLAQIYAGPFLAFAVAAIMMAMAQDRADTHIPAAGLAVFAAFALMASLWHLSVLRPFSPAAFSWLGILALLLCAAGLTLQATDRKTST